MAAPFFTVQLSSELELVRDNILCWAHVRAEKETLCFLCFSQYKAGLGLAPLSPEQKPLLILRTSKSLQHVPLRFCQLSWCLHSAAPSVDIFGVTIEVRLFHSQVDLLWEADSLSTDSSEKLLPDTRIDLWCVARCPCDILGVGGNPNSLVFLSKGRTSQLEWPFCLS